MAATHSAMISIDCDGFQTRRCGAPQNTTTMLTSMDRTKMTSKMRNSFMQDDWFNQMTLAESGQSGPVFQKKVRNSPTGGSA